MGGASQRLNLIPKLANRSIWLQSLRMFLPLAGLTGLIIIPLIRLYEQARYQVIRDRVTSLTEAIDLQLQNNFAEIAANAGVITQLPSVRAAIASPQANTANAARLEGIFQAQINQYQRYVSIAAYHDPQTLMALVRQGEQPWRPSQPAPATSSAVRTALAQSQQLQSGEIWFSPIQPLAVGATTRPGFLAVRAITGADGRHDGTVIFSVNPAILLLDVDRITNLHPGLAQGYLITASGQVVNPSAARTSPNFQQRFPRVWQEIQRHSTGSISTDQGLFVYRRLNPRGRITGAELKGSPRWTAVIQVPPSSLGRTSAFSNPAGQTLLALLYLMLATVSVGRSLYQDELERSRVLKRSADERFRRAMANAPMGMAVLNRDGVITEANPPLCLFLKREASSLIGSSWLSVVDEDAVETERSMLISVVAGEKQINRRTQCFHTTDGQVVWGDRSMALVPGSDGEADMVITQVADITRLIDANTYLTTAANAGIVGIWDWDVSRDVLTWDAVMFQLYGRAPGKGPIEYRTWADSLHPDDRQSTEQAIQRALKGYDTYRPRFRVIWPDGSVHHVQAMGTVERNRQGQPRRMIGVNYDVTPLALREEEVQEQRQQLASILNTMLDPYVHLEAVRDPAGALIDFRFAELNQAACKILGLQKAQLIGKRLRSLQPPLCLMELYDSFYTCVEQDQALVVDNHPIADGRQGRTLYWDVRGVKLQDSISLGWRDVSERHLSARRLAESEALFRLLLQNSLDVVFLEVEGAIRWISPSVETMLGWSCEQWISRNFQAFCHPDDQAKARAMLSPHDGSTEPVQRLRLQDQQQQWRWVELHTSPYCDDAGEQRGSMGSFRVVDREVAEESELRLQAGSDSLTGLLNRRSVLLFLEGHEQGGERETDLIGLLFCDIDHFKQINDTHGHAGGDQVLQTLAERLQQHTREGDLVGRLGGDELVVILRNIHNLEAVLHIAQELHRKVCQPIALAECSIQPTLSIGATVSSPGESVHNLLARADTAMYAAKQEGRNRVVSLMAEA